MRRSGPGHVLARAAAALLAAALACGCYASSAARRSERIVRAGFDLEDHGPWVLFTGPGALLLAGGNLALGSVVRLGGGVDPREPDVKWFYAYGGDMRPASEVAILCHRERSTWVSGIRPFSGEWRDARFEKWHFPACIEALPGRYELEVAYFSRERDANDEGSITRQSESIRPSVVRWEAEAGQVYLLSVYVGEVEPSQAVPPQRHIPRSRDLGTTWWELAERDWYVRVEPFAPWETIEGPVVEQRRAWARYESRRR